MVDLACSWDRDIRTAYRILIGILGKCVLKDGRRNVDNIKIYLSETGYEDGTWLELIALCPSLPQYLLVGCK
jgi:hypothetical protein